MSRIWIVIVAVTLSLILGTGIIPAGQRRTEMPVFEEGELTESVMLVDFCRRTVATVGGDGYSEVVLYETPEGETQVHFYSRYEGDEEESHRAYRAADGVKEKAYELISRYGMAGWNDEEHGPGMTGAIVVLKFRCADGSYIRVSSDNMPDDGAGMMYDVRACLTEGLTEDDLIEVP